MATRIVLEGGVEVVVADSSDEVAAALGDAARAQAFATFKRDQHKFDVSINPATVLFFEHVEVRAIRRELPD